MKIKWKVSEKPVGRYRSFEVRPWPQAEYEDGQLAGMIICSDEYIPADVKTGDHHELKLRIFDYSLGSQQRGVLYAKTRYKTLAEAKIALSQILEQHPEFVPTALRGESK